MLSWLTNNIGTIVVALLLLAAVGGILYKTIKDRKAGKSSCGCGCGCANCAMSCTCHKEK